MSNHRLVSPDDMLKAAKDHMLGGSEPANNRDWKQVMNFVAWNVAAGLEVQICKLFKLLYDIPLEDGEIVNIAEFQASKKGESDVR